MHEEDVMKLRLTVLTGLSVALLAGCSITPRQKSDPVDVSGTVLLPNGQAAKDVTVQFLPTEADQMQGGASLKDGKFNVKLTPGKYTYTFEGTNVRAVPSKYHSNQEDHSFEVPSGGTSDLTIKLTN
jgi:carboxypeptidase family protein